MAEHCQGPYCTPTYREGKQDGVYGPPDCTVCGLNGDSVTPEEDRFDPNIDDWNSAKCIDCGANIDGERDGQCWKCAENEDHNADQA